MKALFFVAAGILMAPTLALAQPEVAPTEVEAQLKEQVQFLDEMLRDGPELGEAAERLKQRYATLVKMLGLEHPDTASSLSNLAEFYQSMDEYAVAEYLHKSALATRQKALGPAHPDTADSLNSLAELYRLMGDYARAEPLFSHALEIYEMVLGPEHRQTAKTLDNLGSLYCSMDDYAQAELLHTRALEIREKVLGAEHLETAMSLDNLASVYCSMGDSGRRQVILTRGVEREPTRFEQAKPLLMRALGIREKALGPEHPNTADSLNNLALLYRSMGHNAQAAALFLRSLGIYEKVLGPEHRRTASVLSNLASLHCSTGDYARAQSLFMRALEIQEKCLGPEHPDTAISLNNIAAHYYAIGDRAQAEPYCKRALQITLARLNTTAEVQSERQQLAMAAEARHYLDSWISLTSSEGADPSDVYEQVLRWKGAVLVRQRALRTVASEALVSQQFAELQSVAMKMATHSRSYPSDPAEVDKWQKRIGQLQETKERLEIELSRKSRAFRAARQPATVAELCDTLPDDTVLIDFLEYLRRNPPQEKAGEWSCQRSLVAFVVRSSGNVQRVELGPVQPIVQAMERWRTGNFGFTNDARTAGAELRGLLWEPLFEHLDDAATLLISPDGTLGRLPLGALPGRRPDTYLIEDHRLVIVPVPQLLPNLIRRGERARPEKWMLAMGGVDYGTPSGEAELEPAAEVEFDIFRSGRGSLRAGAMFEALPGTDLELKSVENIFSRSFGSTLEKRDLSVEDVLLRLTGSDATESRFRAEAPRSYFLHLATHGFFAPASVKVAVQPVEDAHRSLARGLFGDEQARAVHGVNPNLLSGLAFAGANKDPTADMDDGILTSEEIAFLPLANVELATLSACETGLGAVAGGEGLLGVQRSFQISGARSTVASLWKVDDLVTRRLMERFYENLWGPERMSKLDALREAQLWLLNNPAELRGAERQPDASVPIRAPPFYWAAFVLSGDWR